MNKEVIQLDVSIMGQGYKLACKEGEDKALLSAVSYLDKKMAGIRDAGKVKGTDRIAVMAALSVVTELLATKSPEGPMAGLSIAEAKQKIDEMNELMDQALTPQENLF